MDLALFIVAMIILLYFFFKPPKNPDNKSKKFGEGLLQDCGSIWGPGDGGI